MYSKKTYIVILCLMAFVSCKNTVKEVVSSKKDFLAKIGELKEFKTFKKQVDSLQKIGISADVGLILLEEPYFPEDSTKNIMVAFVDKNYGFANQTRLVVRYDVDAKKIISVENASE